MGFVKSLIPKILYFRNELFDIPGRIYIARVDESGGAINKFYREVVQDILFAIDSELSVDTHISKRKIQNAPGNKEALEALLQRMSTHVTRTIMEQWERIFNRSLKDKRIRVSCDQDGDGVYLQFSLIDGDDLFNINQRSTGFRWFFVFILLTQYRGHRNESAIFLYDEPASNLHSTAQQQLLNCFATLPKQFTIIYTTHSHYLINPDWLESTYVVQNIAAGENENIEEISMAKTDIRIQKYRAFVSDNPTGFSYFQPVLDVLQHVPSTFDSVGPALLIEGKNDYYVFRYMSRVQGIFKPSFDMVPCTGSSTVDHLIALYSGWGREFIVLLDGDRAGTESKARYIDKFGPLIESRLVTYADIDASWKKFAAEKIVGDIDSKIITEAVFPTISSEKRSFNLAVQELLILQRKIELKGDANGNFSKIANHLEALFLI